MTDPFPGFISEEDVRDSITFPPEVEGRALEDSPMYRLLTSAREESPAELMLEEEIASIIFAVEDDLGHLTTYTGAELLGAAGKRVLQKYRIMENAVTFLIFAGPRIYHTSLRCFGTDTTVAELITCLEIIPDPYQVATNTGPISPEEYKIRGDTALLVQCGALREVRASLTCINARPYGISREEAFAAVSRERDFQEATKDRWQHGDLGPSVEAELLLAEHYVHKARTVWASAHGNTECLQELRKVAAILVRCFENHGCPEGDRK